MKMNINFDEKVFEDFRRIALKNHPHGKYNVSKKAYNEALISYILRFGNEEEIEAVK